MKYICVWVCVCVCVCVCAYMQACMCVVKHIIVIWNIHCVVHTGDMLAETYIVVRCVEQRCSTAGILVTLV